MSGLLMNFMGFTDMKRKKLQDFLLSLLLTDFWFISLNNHVCHLVLVSRHQVFMYLSLMTCGSTLVVHMRDTALSIQLLD